MTAQVTVADNVLPRPWQVIFAGKSSRLGFKAEISSNNRPTFSDMYVTPTHMHIMQTLTVHPGAMKLVL